LGPYGPPSHLSGIDACVAFAEYAGDPFGGGRPEVLNSHPISILFAASVGASSDARTNELYVVNPHAKAFLQNAAKLTEEPGASGASRTCP
jgi:hypothetical protein